MKLSLIISMLLFGGICNSQEPPSDFDIMKWYWHGFPKTHNGWVIEVQEGIYFHGYTEGIKFSIVNFVCDTCEFLDKYSFNVVLDYGNGNGTSLTVKQNKDSTDKYFKVEYPNFPNSIERRKRKQ